MQNHCDLNIWIFNFVCWQCKSHLNIWTDMACEKGISTPILQKHQYKCTNTKCANTKYTNTKYANTKYTNRIQTYIVTDMACEKGSLHTDLTFVNTRSSGSFQFNYLERFSTVVIEEKFLKSTKSLWKQFQVEKLTSLWGLVASVRSMSGCGNTCQCWNLIL